MPQVVTNAGEALFAQKAQANEQLDIDTFIFAYVPGQDSQAPVDRSEGLPPTAQQVHTQPVQQVGRINSNTVVYSTVLNSLTGPFEFNWVGLYSSVNNTLVAISHVKSVNKTITELGNVGNTLNRNFAIEYSGISDITGITVAPETWQLDFSARLAGMDALTQNLAMDMNGRDWFIGDGFKIEPTANDDEFRVISGVGYVHGMRVELEQDYVFSVQSYPQNVYVDAWFESDVSSQWSAKKKLTESTLNIKDYLDDEGRQHFVVKLATLTEINSVTDLRDKSKLAKEKLIDTVSELRLSRLSEGDYVKTFGYKEAGDSPHRNHIVKTVARHRVDIADPEWQPKTRLDIPLEGKAPPLAENDLVAIYKSDNGRITYRQCGYDENEASKALTANALAEGSARDNLTIVFDSNNGKLVDTNSQFNFSGRPIDLNGNTYRFSPGNVGRIYGGFAELRDTWKNGAPNSTTKIRNIDAVFNYAAPSMGSKSRYPIKVGEADVDASNGGSILTWRKCADSKYWIFETIVTQNSSGSATSIDTYCPAWRLGTLSMCDYVGTQLFQHSAISGNPVLVEVEPPGTGNSKPNKAKINRFGGEGNWIEYTSICYENIAILFQYTMTGTLDALVEVFDKNGHKIFEQGEIKLKSSTYNQELFVWKAINPRPGEKLTVRVTNRTTIAGESVFMGVGGIGAIVDNSVTSKEIDNIFYSSFNTGDEKVRSFFDGAMSYAIMEYDLLKFGGESHGGEAMDRQDIYIDGEIKELVNGDYFTAEELKVEQSSRTTFPNSSYFDTSSQHKFYSYPARHDYNATHDFSKGFMAKIAYGPMLTTHSQMDKMVLPEVINASQDGFSGLEERYELGKTEYVRIESSVNPFINEMWFSSFDGNYNESTPWWKIGFNANDARKFYYGPVSSTCCGAKDLSKQPYATNSVRVYN